MNCIALESRDSGALSTKQAAHLLEPDGLPVSSVQEYPLVLLIHTLSVVKFTFCRVLGSSFSFGVQLISLVLRTGHACADFQQYG